MQTANLWSVMTTADARKICGMAVAILALTAPLPVVAQPSSSNGHALAQRLCVGCHVVDSGKRAAPPAVGVPTFRSIANKAGQSGARLRDALIAPPHQMPDMMLTLREIDDILAYLQSMRADPTAPPFAPGTIDRDKPTYPQPS